jgi:hypothetical protein
LPQWLKDDADKIEHEALRRSDRVLLSSDWAKTSAIVDYGAAPAAITVLPLGPNISSDLIERYKPTKTADFLGGVRLLFIGADWDRKGGPVVLEIKRHLDSLGIPCELFLVGNCPKDSTSPMKNSFANCVGYMNSRTSLFYRPRPKPMGLYFQRHRRSGALLSPMLSAALKRRFWTVLPVTPSPWGRLRRTLRKRFAR